MSGGASVFVDRISTSEVTFEMDLAMREDVDGGISIVSTPYGDLSVTVKGDRGKPALITYHDIGLNHQVYDQIKRLRLTPANISNQSTFNTFQSDCSNEALSNRFCWYHIDAPGQEQGADKLPNSFVYPSMTQLAEQIEYVVEYFQLGYFIGLGVGAGANVLARYAMLNPERVSGLVLVNFDPQSVSWTNLSRLSGKAVSWQLKGREAGISRLASHHLKQYTFGFPISDVDSDLARTYVEAVEIQQPNNLALFMDSYYKRSSVSGDFVKNVECACLFIVSSSFAHKDTVVKLCSLLDPQKATYLELSNTSGLLLGDQPSKVGIALKLFLQGLGFAPSLSTLSVPSPVFHDCIVIEGIPARLHPLEA